MEVSRSLINQIYSAFSDGVHFASPISSLRTNEADLVRGVLQILQGFSNSLFHWDSVEQRFHAKSGIYVSHLSETSLHAVLDQFMYAATCLQHVEVVVRKLETSLKYPPPTPRAFACSVSAWLKRLRDIALKEEVMITKCEHGITPTLLGLVSSLSSLCSGSEYLLQIVRGAIPQAYFELNSSLPAADIAVNILDHLYMKLNEICLVQGGEEDAYRMLLYLFVGSILPYVEGLDSWLFEGTLDDPFEEMFFFANKAISIDETEFWEKSYLLRPVQPQKLNVVSATDCVPLTNDKKEMTGKESNYLLNSVQGKERGDRELHACPLFIKDIAKAIVSAGKSLQLIRHAPMTFSPVYGRRDNHDIGDFANSDDNIGFSKTHSGQRIAGLTLSEAFCVSLVGLIGHGDHISKSFWQDDPCNSKIFALLQSFANKQKLEEGNGGNFWAVQCQEKLMPSFSPENPAITVCRRSLHENKDVWGRLNLSRSFYLPPLNDEGLRDAISGRNSVPFSAPNYNFGLQFGESDHIPFKDETKMLQALFPFPTLLPSIQEDVYISELLPFQKNSTLPSKVLSWLESVEPKATPLSVVILQECLIVYIKKQVDYIGRNILSKLLHEWRLMDELGLLRAIYLLGSGDLLQHFLTVIFNKLDKGESCDDDFELNMILQESIRNSADGLLLSAPDSLVVSVTKNNSFGDEEQHNTSFLVSNRKSCGQSFGIDGLDSLKFTYKVSWPLELIANTEAIKKYNQVMGFLFKVKRAKFVLDKARRWMWKGRGTATINRKHHWLVEQKLLHFVDAFHQYVMDRVYHSAWRELCEGMAAAGSLDEVIEVHEAYLLSIQRQCFVVPDKLWALIASRINTILGLALDFYSIQQTLSSGGAVSAIKARCEMEVDRTEKQFDDCIAFLLRVLSFKLNVGHFPHLADLVTRINYNHFYMSDSGNAITAPGADAVSSKLGKGFPARPD